MGRLPGAKRDSGPDAFGLQEWLPRCFTAFFTAATLWLLFAEFTPAVRAYVDARESEREQLDLLDSAFDAIEREERAYRSLLLDPQRIEAELDARGVLPPGHPGRRAWTEVEVK